jgi:hypothetical protein
VGFAHVAEADDTESDDFHSGVKASGLVWRVKVEVGRLLGGAERGFQGFQSYFTRQGSSGLLSP